MLLAFGEHDAVDFDVGAGPNQGHMLVHLGQPAAQVGCMLSCNSLRNCRMGIRSSPSLRSGRRILLAAWRRKSAIFTPGIATGRWKARNKTRPCPLPRLHRQHVLAVQFDPALRNLVTGVAHDGEAEGALARTVRPHQRVDLAPAYLQTDTLEDRLLADADVKIGNRIACCS